MTPADASDAVPVRAPRRRAGSAPSARPSRGRLDTAERRAQLIALGLATFSDRTYDEVSIDDLASAAGISKGLLYHYFPTKRDFYLASMREVARRLLAVSDVPDRGEPAVERLARSVDAYLDYAARHTRSFTALLRSGVGSDPEMARVVEETRQQFLSRLLRGSHGPQPDPRIRATLRGWVGFVEAVSLDWIEHSDLDLAEIRDVLIRVLFSEIGLGPEGWRLVRSGSRSAPRASTPLGAVPLSTVGVATEAFGAAPDDTSMQTRRRTDP